MKNLIFLLLTIVSFLPIRALAGPPGACARAILGVNAEMSGLYNLAHETGSKPLYRALQHKIAKASAAGVSVQGFLRERLDTGEQEREARESSKELQPRNLVPLDFKTFALTEPKRSKNQAFISGYKSQNGNVGNFVVVDSETGAEVRQQDNPRVEYSPNGTYLIGLTKMESVAGEFRVLATQTVPNGRPETFALESVPALTSTSRQLSFAIDDRGRYFISSSETGFQFGELNASPNGIAFAETMKDLIGRKYFGFRLFGFSQDGKYLIFQTANATLEIWNTHSGQMTSHISVPGKSFSDIQVSKDGQTVGVLTSDRTLELFNTATGDKVIEFKAPQGEHLVSFSFGEYGYDIFLGYDTNVIKLHDSNYPHLEIQTLPTRFLPLHIHFSAEDAVLSSSGIVQDGASIERWRRLPL
jgi:WD40 repeat protein